MPQSIDIPALRKQIGGALKQARKNAGMTQDEAADRLSALLGDDIGPSRIGNYEQGYRMPDVPTIMALCKVYSTWPSAIYGFDEAPQSQEELAVLMKFRQTDSRGKSMIQRVAESQPEYKDAEVDDEGPQLGDARRAG